MSEGPPDPGLRFDLGLLDCDGTRTLAVSGELDLASAPQFDAAVATAFDASPHRIVVDLGAARFIDSSGIRSLVMAHRRAQADDVSLTIVPAPDQVQAVFALCRLETLLPFVGDGAP